MTHRRRRSPLLIATGSLAVTALLAGTALPAAARPAEVDGTVALADYTPRSFPLPVSKTDNFTYSTRSVYWSVLGVSGPSGADLDVALYDDSDHSVYLEKSQRGVGFSEFVAVDSNHRPLGDYYAEVSYVRGSGANYRIELAQGEDMLIDKPKTIRMTTKNVVAVRDTFLLAGTTYTITVKPTTGAQDPSLFLMQSVGTYIYTWVRTRNQAVAASDIAPPGDVEKIVFTPSVSDWYGVIILNEAGGGRYTLTRTTS